ncbi:MAG: helix-turn-helix transcriptional regulator [Clostridia bacterium]|nr:helix-turn-helix transcriptional regulator [Clostridia bacterium]
MTHEERRANRASPARGDSGRTLTAAAKAYVEAHSAEKFSLQAVADALFVNGSYLLRIFKANTGHTLLWYHNHVRCEKAKALLLSSDKSVSEAGEEAGFVSSAHFSHVFKKMNGMTPSAYRDAARHAANP